jgi:hypothetical protein
MSVQRRNDELVDLLTPDFQARDEPNFAWRCLSSAMLSWPVLYAAWPMSANRYTSASRVRDIASQLYSLQENGDPTYGYDNLAPVCYLDGTGDDLTRADGGAGNWADIIGNESHVIAANRGLTVGGWFNFENAATQEGLITKATAVGAGVAYYIEKQANDTIRAAISNNGVAIFTADSAATTTGVWYCCFLRYVPSTSVQIFLNGVFTTTVAAIPATLNDSAADFHIGVFGGGTARYSGYVSACLLSASCASEATIQTFWHQTRTLYGR